MRFLCMVATTMEIDFNSTKKFYAIHLAVIRAGLEREPKKQISHAIQC